jgi:hypothetical protein
MPNIISLYNIMENNWHDEITESKMMKLALDSLQRIDPKITKILD